LRVFKFVPGFVLAFSLMLLPGIKGGIKGRVVDQGNQPLEAATITIISVEHPSERHVLKTNKKGEFIQIGLEPGFFNVEGEKEGYAADQAQVKVPISAYAEVALKLGTRGMKGEEPEVSGMPEADRGYQLYQQGKYEEALKEYQAAILKNPDQAVNFYNLGVVLVDLRRNDEAIEAFKKAIEIQPDHRLALKFLGRLYGDKNEHDQAKKYLVLASGLSPADPEVFYNLGAILMNTADYPGASEAFQKAIACRADYIDAYYQLGLIYVNQNKLDEATSTFEKFIVIAPNDARAANVRQLIESIKKK